MTRNEPKTYGELWQLPLAELYRLVIGLRVEESRFLAESFAWYHWPAYPKLGFRLLGGPLSAKALACMDGREAMRLRAASSLNCFIRLFDHMIDPGDLSPEREESAWDYLIHATGFAYALDNPGMIANSEALPEMAALVYSFRVCLEELGIDPVESWQAIWANFLPEAWRVIRGEAFANRETLALAQSAYTGCIVQLLEILGVPKEIAARIPQLTAPLHYADVLRDILHDIRTRNVQIPLEDLEAIGLDLNALLSCRTYNDLAALPGFAHVFAATAQNCYEQWTRNRPEAIRLVDQNISSPVARVAVRYMMHRLSGILQEEAERFGPIPAALRHLAAVR